MIFPLKMAGIQYHIKLFFFICPKIYAKRKKLLSVALMVGALIGIYLGDPPELHHGRQCIKMLNNFVESRANFEKGKLQFSSGKASTSVCSNAVAQLLLLY